MSMHTNNSSSRATSSTTVTTMSNYKQPWMMIMIMMMMMMIMMMMMMMLPTTMAVTEVVVPIASSQFCNQGHDCNLLNNNNRICGLASCKTRIIPFNRHNQLFASNKKRIFHDQQEEYTPYNEQDEEKHSNRQDVSLALTREATSTISTSTTTISTSSTTISSLRGGDTIDLNNNNNNNILDLDRVEIRLGSLEEYCVIASVILGAVIDIYGDSPETMPTDPIERLAYAIHGICVSIGFLAAVYTTVVFSLFGLYAKTALGAGDDVGYLQLLAATSTIRSRGFQSFLLCLSTFQIAFLMNLILNHTGMVRWVIFGTAVIGTIYSITQFQFIIDTASAIIFQ